MKTMLTAAETRYFARKNGIHAVGWFAAADFSQYSATIRARVDYHGIAYRPLAAFLEAGRVPEGIRTVIVTVMDYFVESSDRPDGYRLTNYARACWSTMEPKTKAMVDFLKAKGYRAKTVGIASIGTDALLEEVGPVQERVTHPQCGKCLRCISACPVGAISAAGYQIEPLRCLSFVNRHPDEPLRIMPQKREQFDRWLYGCETCQNVCPLNAEASHRHEAVVTPEVVIEGMTIPNTAIVPEETVEAGLASCTSPGYQEYIRRLLETRSEVAGAGDV